MKVESGKQQELVGFINKIIEDSVSIIPEKEDTLQMMPHILLSDLAPHYLPRDNVKHRWMNSHKIVALVNDTDQKLIYVQSNPVQEVRCFNFTMIVITTDRLVNYDFQEPSEIL
jgi:hypothetical protein